ncbi:GAF domain-containing protein [Mastigocoleus testarum]|uniref:Phytochrome chromophore attachment site domain-containing protein n=1 Tax=Mastigocoleus testarum BC008 TaxID=371196 RepID=A0A0V8A0Y2_9CYAN|nr:GAF domain-containing protein [Mastigocoleus testarum]KST65380.1 hypothetical protein BC008_21525 [Mastigocoleus testarum BC008]KST70444.1 hypothetical protein BC008_45480 [Mastigocoleus testarum BC008]
MQNFNQPKDNSYKDVGLEKVLQQVKQRIERDELIIKTTDRLRESLQVDRVVLYYFYNQWSGQVTFESLNQSKYSIIGSTGPDESFNDEYAAMYLQGRVRAINDIETASIHQCHREFLRELQVRANLVVPVLTPKGLWGLLVAHHCQAPRNWSISDIEVMEQGAQILATSPTILRS